MRGTILLVSVVVMLVVGVGIVYVVRPGNPLPSVSSSSTVTAETCTVIQAISYIYCPTPTRISAEGTPGASPNGSNTLNQGAWNFTVSISSDSVTAGQSILLNANLTNVSGQSVTIKNFAAPYINPTVSYANGTQVWAWNPPEVTLSNQTFTNGESLHQDVSIPTSQLRQGTYIITVAPISIQFPTPNDYTFTFRVNVLTFQCQTGAALMTVDGSTYCASDVSQDIVVQQPGYSYFPNSSITFMGVKFETICLSNYEGCPGSSNINSTTVTAAAIQLSLTFPDGAKEMVGGVIGDSTYFFVLSNHFNPKAGILIEHVTRTNSYKTFLLVSPG